MFLEESRFNMSYNDGHIRVRSYAGEHNLRACILQRHRGSMTSVMVWGTIGYNMRSRPTSSSVLVSLHIEDNLNSKHYIWEVLQPEVMPLPSGNSTCHISAGQCPATCGKDCARLLPKTRGITASLACTFAH